MKEIYLELIFSWLFCANFFKISAIVSFVEIGGVGQDEGGLQGLLVSPWGPEVGISGLMGDGGPEEAPKMLYTYNCLSILTMKQKKVEMIYNSLLPNILSDFYP